MEGALSVAGVAFATAITPGPNNAAILALGSRAGLRGALPAILIMISSVLLMTLGLGRLLLDMPATLTAMFELAGGCVLGAMAIAGLRTAAQSGNPVMAAGFSLRSIAAFQLLNPKAWLFAALVVAAAKPAGTSLWVAGSVAAAISALCLMLWASCGALLARAASKPMVARSARIGISAILLAIGLVMAVHAMEVLT